MILSLNEEMKSNKRLIDRKNVKENSICVGLDKTTNQYCRLHIIKIEKESGKEDRVGYLGTINGLNFVLIFHFFFWATSFCVILWIMVKQITLEPMNCMLSQIKGF